MKSLVLRISLLFLLTLNFLHASEALEETIEKLVEPSSLVTHKKLLGVLFQYDDEFTLPNGRIDIIKVVGTLKENGLIKLFHRTPTSIHTTFSSEMNPLFMMKALSDTLTKLGYHYILTHELAHDHNVTHWTVAYKSQHAIDPISLATELNKYNITVDSLDIDDTKWHYRLSSQEPVLLDIAPIPSGLEDMTPLNDPRGEYWIQVESNASVAFIKSHYPDLWHPYIICYNSNLEILKMYKRDRATKSIKLLLPEGTKYIKLTDMFTSENLKHGIGIRIEGAE